MNKIRCSVLALLMAISPISTFAFTIKPVAPPGNTPVTLNTTPLTFNATVPTGLPLDLAANGVVTPATEASIINNSIGPIKVVSVTTTAVDSWKLTNYTDDFSTKRVNSKDIALQFNKDNVQSSGGIALTPQNWPAIAGSDSLRLDYQGKLAPQSTGFTADTAANVSFVLDWDSSASVPEPPADKYIMATDADFSGTLDGEFKYIGTDKFVEIPHVIQGVPVTSYKNMFAGTSVEGIKSTNKNITTMESMFYESQATILDLSNLDTSSVTSMFNMFSYCKATTLDLSNFDTSKVTNMSGMFTRSKITTLDVSKLDTSRVTNMSDMFAGSLATTLDVSSFNTSNVTNMSGMFGWSKATTLDVSNFDTSNVTDMTEMFYFSPATTLDLSSFDTSKVTNMSGMFWGSKATTLDLNNFDTSSVTDMNHMFASSKATTLDLSDLNTSNVTNMSGMFSDIEVITLDLSKFNTSNVRDMSSMFSNSKITTLDVSSFDTSKVTHMFSMFQYSYTTILDLSSFDTSNVEYIYSMFLNSKATTGYARTQTDANKFNANGTSKPSDLTFRVK